MGFFVGVGVAVAYLLPARSQPPVFAWYEWSIVLLLLSIWALRYRLREVKSAAQRRFWNHLAVSQVLWLFAHILEEVQRSTSLALLMDSLYLSSNFALFLAAEIRTDRNAARSPGDPQQRINLVGSILFFLGSFVYFALIPGFSASAYHWLPASSIQLTQVLYLAFRFWHLSLNCDTQRWRMIYRLLTIVAAGWLAADGLSLISYLPNTPVDLDALPHQVELVWYVWFPPFILAARLRHCALAGENSRAAGSGRGQSYWIPLFVGAVLLPFIHLLIYSLELADAAIQRPRDSFLLVYLLALGFMVLLQQKVQEKKSRALKDERQRAEDARHRFTQILEATTDIVTMMDENGRTLYLNRAGRKALGFDEGEDLSHLPISAYHPEPVAESLVREAIPVARKLGVWRNETKFLTRDGCEIPTLLALMAHKDTAGKVEYFSSIGRDISERIRREEVLRRAKEAAEAGGRAKEEFMATISHEIRTPMNGVIGLTSVLLDGPLAGQQREYLENIQASGDVLLSIIDGILDFSRIEWGGIDLETEPFELRPLVEEALALVSSAAALKGLDLSYRIGEGAPERLVGDVTRIRQILVNLLSNAVKFTDRGRVSVSLSLRPAGDGRCEAHFAVEDTGIGILPERRERLFQPFSQVDASTTRKYGGTGLGLVICKRLVELMGGRIWVESTAGEGSKFHFTILGETATRPAGAGSPAGDAQPSRPSGEELAQTDHATLRVLVAEDNPVNQMVARRMLEQLGCRVDAVANGLEALEAFRHQPYDVVLMDVQMPEMDGLEAARRICRERRGEGGPRIIGLTAHAMEGDRERCLAAGMDDYLSKPVKIDDLQAALQSASSTDGDGA